MSISDVILMDTLSWGNKDLNYSKLTYFTVRKTPAVQKKVLRDPGEGIRWLSLLFV